MKALVVYDSEFGNTRKIAESIAGKVKARAVHVDKFENKILKSVDLLIIGSPIQRWSPTHKTSSFLSKLREMSLQGVKSAAFDTGFRNWLAGSAAKSIVKTLLKSGADIIVKPKKFIVTGIKGPLRSGEIDKAKQWADSILEKLDMT